MNQDLKHPIIPRAKEFYDMRAQLEGSLEKFGKKYLGDCSHEKVKQEVYKPKQVGGKLSFTEPTSPEE